MIVLDLEWNQPFGGRRMEEIIQIGAVRLAEPGGAVQDWFNMHVKPVIYPKLSPVARKLPESAQALTADVCFTEAYKAFLDWCGGAEAAGHVAPPPPQREVQPRGVPQAAAAEIAAAADAGAGAQQPGGAVRALSPVPCPRRGGGVVPAGQRVLRHLPLRGARAVPGADVRYPAAGRHVAGSPGGADADGAGAFRLCRRPGE